MQTVKTGAFFVPNRAECRQREVMYSRVRLQLEGRPHSGGPGYILNDCCQLPRGLKSIDKELPARSSAPAGTAGSQTYPREFLSPMRRSPSRKGKWQMADVANITKNWLYTVTLSLFGAN
jgi:hypothetical protein